MSFDLFLVLLAIIFGFISLYLLLKKMLSQQSGEAQLEDVVNKVFGLSAHKIAQQSKQILEGEKETIKVDLENKQRAIERLVKDLQDDIKQRQSELRSFEKDRSAKFGQITTELKQYRQVSEKLELSTNQLAKVLSNNQERGSWGERIIEDLMTTNGLIEGVHYLRQKQLEGTKLKPDITLLLPNNRFVPVDVKFPYSEIQKMAESTTKSAKLAHQKQFALDLRTKVKKVAEYIDPEHNTLDYAIMFVPNEMVFSYINKHFPKIVDDAIGRRVIIVSPFTFLIVARTVMESYRNFMMEDRLRDVVKNIDSFVKEWSRFKDHFGKYGRAIGTLKSAYEEMTGTRFRQMDRRIEKVESSQQGALPVGKKSLGK